MACDSTEQLRAEYGPFHTRMEAEIEARKLGFEYLLRYEHIVGKNDEIQEVRSIVIEFQEGSQLLSLPAWFESFTPAAPVVASLLLMTSLGAPKSGPTFMNLNTPATVYAYSSRPARQD